MEYRARKAYQNKDVVSEYDIRRFKSLKGRFVNKMELHLINKALNYAGIIPPATILDIPCGTGRLSINLAQSSFEVRSVDLSPAMVLYTKEKVRQLNLTNKIRVEVGDAECLSYPDNSFDACVSLRLFGHTPSKIKKKILEELKRVVKKHLILVYYHRNCLQYFLKKNSRNKAKIEWHPITFKQLEKELTQIGLKKIKSFFLAKGISETIVILTQK